MSATCEFGDVKFEIEEQIIIGGTSTKIRRRALRDPTFDLKAMLLEGRRNEQSKYQAQQIESKVEPTVGETNKLEQGNKCRNCGREYLHSSACPAKGKTCNKCAASRIISRRFVVGNQHRHAIVETKGRTQTKHANPEI